MKKIKKINIVFRYDDFSSKSDTLFEKKLINIFKANKCSFTIGIIPFVCDGVKEKKTPFDGCRRSTRQQPVALRFRIWYQEMKCWSIATAIPDSSDPRINFAMRQNRPDPRRRRVMKEEVRTTSARPALKCFAIAGTKRPKLFLKIKK